MLYSSSISLSPSPSSSSSSFYKAFHKLRFGKCLCAHLTNSRDVVSYLAFCQQGPTLYGLAIIGAMGEISIGFIECLVFSSLIVAVDPVAVSCRCCCRREAVFVELSCESTCCVIQMAESFMKLRV